MGEPAGQPADRLHFLALEELRLAAVQGRLGLPAPPLAPAQRDRGHGDESHPDRQEDGQQHAATHLVALEVLLDGPLQLLGLAREEGEGAVELGVRGGAHAHVLAAGHPLLP